MSAEDTPEWALWWQDDIPCAFSPAQAARNAEYLSEKLGQRFIRLAQHPIGQQRHPLLQRWKTRGAGAFLELNSLAEDLRVVDRAQGIEGVLADLRDSNLAMATWHVIHTAALLSRPPGTAIEKFFTTNDRTLPDYLLNSQGTLIAVEAKLLSKSGNETAFEQYATELARRVLAEVLPLAGAQPGLTVVLKDSEDLPSIEDVVAAVSAGKAAFTGGMLRYRNQKFNAFLEETPLLPGTTASRSCNILCPRSMKEDLRVARPGKDASSQLAATTTAHYPGVVALGITRLQYPRHVAALFRRRFAAGQMSGIAGVMLITAGTHFGPPQRAPLDVVAVVRNERSQKHLPNIAFQQLGLLGQFAHDDINQAVPAYRHQTMEIKADGKPLNVGIPDLRELRAEMLE